MEVKPGRLPMRLVVRHRYRLDILCKIYKTSASLHRFITLHPVFYAVFTDIYFYRKLSVD
ncbi:hypothetical protein NSTC731_06122 [Nostoc sp. DSM 114167]|jgi:hypothetical protein